MLSRFSQHTVRAAKFPQFLAASPMTLRREFHVFQTSKNMLDDWTQSESLARWVEDRVKLLQPDRVHLVDGSEEENTILLQEMVHNGTLIKLNENLRPGSYMARSPPSDVARVEEQTFICSENKDDAGVTNNWKDPEETTTMMEELFDGAMRGRTMFVIPFIMGPVGSPFSQVGVEVTDSPYVVTNMRLMTRMGKPALDQLGDGRNFIPCVHSVGQPLTRGKADTPWPCNANEKYIVHFPEQRRIWSYGSGYGGNALLGKKCFALRIASCIAREEGWLAEHMLIVGITNPEGQKKYLAAAFPSACGKTNLAMMEPKLPGWKVETVGDDIAWMRPGEDGRLWAINPEAGFFGVAPGTSVGSNPHAMTTLRKNAIFTNCAITPEGDVWWEGMTKEPPASASSWLRSSWTPDCSYDAAHANARFTVPASQCPTMDPEWENPAGVPIEAIIFGGRRSNTVPLVYQSRDWAHGTYMGATMNSETTAAAAGVRGVLRADPFAMKPFLGYNIGDYLSHWLSFTERTEESKLPKIFHVNWFRKSPSGKFLWPGFGDNIRIIKWIFERCDKDVTDTSDAQETKIGYIPKIDSLQIDDLNLEPGTMETLFAVNDTEWATEVKRDLAFLENLGPRTPDAILDQARALQAQVAPTKKKN